MERKTACLANAVRSGVCAARVHAAAEGTRREFVLAWLRVCLRGRGRVRARVRKVFWCSMRVCSHDYALLSVTITLCFPASSWAESLGSSFSFLESPDPRFIYDDVTRANAHQDRRSLESIPSTRRSSVSGTPPDTPRAPAASWLKKHGRSSKLTGQEREAARELAARHMTLPAREVLISGGPYYIKALNRLATLRDCLCDCGRNGMRESLQSGRRRSFVRH